MGVSIVLDTIYFNGYLVDSNSEGISSYTFDSSLRELLHATMYSTSSNTPAIDSYICTEYVQGIANVLGSIEKIPLACTLVVTNYESTARITSVLNIGDSKTRSKAKNLSGYCTYVLRTSKNISEILQHLNGYRLSASKHISTSSVTEPEMVLIECLWERCGTWLKNHYSKSDCKRAMG